MPAPPDDLELEWERIAEAERAQDYGSDTDGPEEFGRHAVRPEFPPPSLQLQEAFPKMGDEMGGDLLMAWSFVHSFRDILGVDAFTVDELIEALFKGQASEMLSNIHIGLIRLIQANMEESHYLVVT
ncbi:hypothetical protein BSKO_12975 [Bryopsis sp. KO-2023]|nr:hypothetical protein BSKO_12975 [Bryopsis sp. KO-2023]